MNNLNTLEKSVYKSLLVSKKLKKDLILEFSMPKTTINRVLENLLNKNLIEKNGLENSTGGRKPIIYATSSNNFYSIGVDLSRSYSEIIILNSSLEIIFKNRFNMTAELEPIQTVTKICELIKNAITNLNLNIKKFIGLGLGVIDPIDVKTGQLGQITNSLNNNWTDINIKNLFLQLLDLPVFLNRGTTMATIGESFINQNKAIKKIIYINIGRGIRYSFINNGKTENPIGKIYDPLAHMTIKINGKPCICGKYGCLELYASINTMEDFFNASQLTCYTKIDDIFLLFKKGNSKAKEIIDTVLFTLAVGINNLSDITNPDKVILNGPLIQKDNYVFERLIDNFKNLNTTIDIESVYSCTPYFGESSISVGSAIACIIDTFNF